MTAARSAPIGRVAMLVGLAFAAFYAGTSRGVFVFGDDILMYQVTAAIWERGEVAVTSESSRRDIAHAVRGSDGRRYAKYGLGPSLVALPFYGASHRLFDRCELLQTADGFGNLRTGATVFGTGLANAAIGGATVAGTFLLAVELGYPLLVALATAFCLGAATLLPHYASTFLSEPLSALCLAVGVLGLLKAKGKGSVKGVVAERGWLATSGFAAGLVVATKVAHVVVVWPLLAWAAVLGWRRARLRGVVVHTLYWSSFFSVWLAAIAAYNWSRFGSVFATCYGRDAVNFAAAQVMSGQHDMTIGGGHSGKRLSVANQRGKSANFAGQFRLQIMLAGRIGEKAFLPDIEGKSADFGKGGKQHLERANVHLHTPKPKRW